MLTKRDTCHDELYSFASQSCHKKYAPLYDVLLFQIKSNFTIKKQYKGMKACYWYMKPSTDLNKLTVITDHPQNSQRTRIFRKKDMNLRAIKRYVSLCLSYSPYVCHMSYFCHWESGLRIFIPSKLPISICNLCHSTDFFSFRFKFYLSFFFNAYSSLLRRPFSFWSFTNCFLSCCNLWYSTFLWLGETCKFHNDSLRAYLNKWEEPTVSYRRAGWVWGITGWSSRLQEDNQPFLRNLENIPQHNKENWKMSTCNRSDLETMSGKVQRLVTDETGRVWEIPGWSSRIQENHPCSDLGDFWA